MGITLVERNRQKYRLRKINDACAFLLTPLVVSCSPVTKIVSPEILFTYTYSSSGFKIVEKLYQTKMQRQHQTMGYVIKNRHHIGFPEYQSRTLMLTFIRC